MIYIINFGSSRIQAISDCIVKCGVETVVRDWNLSHTQAEGLSGIVLSGSPTLLTETGYETFANKIEPVLNWGVPILGICFGHQLLGMMHGGRIFKSEPVRRMETIRMRVKNDALFEGFEEVYEMEEDHTEGISLPPGFIHLAYSPSFALEAMKHPEKEIRGVQFHPETSGQNGMKLFWNFTELCQQRSA